MCMCKISERYHSTEKHCLLPCGQNGAELKDGIYTVTIPTTRKELAAHGGTEESMGGVIVSTSSRRLNLQPISGIWPQK